MNHLRNASRFGVILFWSVVIGLIHSAFNNIDNSKSLGWPTWLFYGSVGGAIIYGGASVTPKLWNIK
jgi:hypothetical protein